ncbi:hypothetical protein AG1IA_06349 [Rhizoctonia solani AG-1 IA]|uniref:Uncharacterized protein n=1 Tax=Thanatephorus cucumeris (strain AG1-IA) TaxID=983506 RepID=L8WTA4_THACA|nr:hypothetical protein AG1IA_06349 [Rhizoctonia solani AG-1 IA]
MSVSIPCEPNSDSAYGGYFNAITIPWVGRSHTHQAPFEPGSTTTTTTTPPLCDEVSIQLPMHCPSSLCYLIVIHTSTLTCRR